MNAFPCDTGTPGPKCGNTWLDTREARTSCRVFGRESSGQLEEKQSTANRSGGAVEDGEVVAVLQAHINVLVVTELQLVCNQTNFPVLHSRDGLIGGSNRKQAVEQRQFLFLCRHAIKFFRYQKVF